MKYLSRLSKLPMEYYFVFFLFLIVIGMSIYGNGAGYHAFGEARSLSMYNYENFETNVSQHAHSAANVSGQEGPALQSTKGVLGMFEVEGLKAAPVDAPSLVDPVSRLKGSPECVGQSNGYSNSMGGLCLTDDVRQQFMTRGGNQATGEAQIGS